MSEIHPDLIEKYQILLEKDPKSQVFAPLSEAYRKMGLIEEAFRISSRGVQFHPRFAGGHIALANVLMEKEQYENAKDSLERAVELSPENILAFHKLGECYLHLRKGKEALRAFKMVLLFSPNNTRAQKAVQKLETLTADEFEEDVFKMDRVSRLDRNSQANMGGERLEVLKPTDEIHHQSMARDLERQLSLMEAYLVRGQQADAQEIGEKLSLRFPENEKVQKRLQALRRRMNLENESLIEAPPESSDNRMNGPSKELQRTRWIRDEKIKLLENLLRRVRENHDQNESLV